MMSEWGTFNDYFFIQYMTEKKPRAFFIHDKVFADVFNDVYEMIWDNLATNEPIKK